jgi:hypothetical protein
VSETLQEIINRLYIAPDNAVWTPKTDVVALDDVRNWFKSADIEILGFAYSLVNDARFRIEPPLSINEYKDFAVHYYGRCFREDPEGEWSDSRHSAGTDLVNLFASLWRDPGTPRCILKELKDWLGHLYQEGDGDARQCLVQATLEHLFEQEDIRNFFSDWKNDPVLAAAHAEASEWYLGGGNTSLGKPSRNQ